METCAREELLSIDELASYLGVGRGSIYRWNYRGTGPRRIRIGTRVMYRASDVQAWLESRVV